jgi:carbon starvation protein
MNVAVLLLFALIALGAAYLFYGAYLSRRLGIDPNRPTPAHTMTDGVDYVPAKAPILLGHHFASIAGASPIIGPVTAAVFGWVPVLLWVVFGSIFIGGAHDMSSLVASVRHKGKSIGEIIEDHIGISGKVLFLIFSLSTLVLIIAVFTNIVARTFVSTPAAATASLLFLLLAVIFGQALYRFRVPLGPATIVGVLLLVGSIWAGVQWPLAMSEGFWTGFLIAYIFVAAVTPVWALLQPRDYLNSFLLYAILAGAAIGILVARPAIQMPAFTGFTSNLGFIFPVLFVTVACGAVSGFHSLVASGTTAKQLDNEKDSRVVSYGGMLIEGLLAVIALATVTVLATGDYADRLVELGPVTLFSQGVGSFLAAIGISIELGTSFAALAVSAFALTSLDTCTRLGRYAFTELFEWGASGDTPVAAWTQNRWIGTAVVVAAGGGLALSGQWQTIWPIFGSANQLLAALALLAVSIWLARLGKRALFTRLPMYFMFAVTLTALISFTYRNAMQGNFLLAFLSLWLFVLAVVMVVLAYRSLSRGLTGTQSDTGEAKVTPPIVTESLEITEESVEVSPIEDADRNLPPGEA